MSRSYKKTPITGMSLSGSEKQDKRIANRSLRRKVRSLIDFEDGCDLQVRDVSDVWCFSKDGRQWLGKRCPELLRK